MLRRTQGGWLALFRTCFFCFVLFLFCLNFCFFVLVHVVFPCVSPRQAVSTLITVCLQPRLREMFSLCAKHRHQQFGKSVKKLSKKFLRNTFCINDAVSELTMSQMSKSSSLYFGSVMSQRVPQGGPNGAPGLSAVRRKDFFKRANVNFKCVQAGW